MLMLSNLWVILLQPEAPNLLNLTGEEWTKAIFPYGFQNGIPEENHKCL